MYLVVPDHQRLRTCLPTSADLPAAEACKGANALAAKTASPCRACRLLSPSSAGGAWAALMLTHLTSTDRKGANPFNLWHAETLKASAPTAHRILLRVEVTCTAPSDKQPYRTKLLYTPNLLAHPPQQSCPRSRIPEDRQPMTLGRTMGIFRS